MSTSVPVPRTNYSIRFSLEMWIIQYLDPNNEAYKNKVVELTKKIASALNITDTLVIIYSLK